MPEPLRTPVAFIIFNRPVETAEVFAAIRAARPTQLFVIADGPRNDADVPLCEAARAEIKVDWPCEVKTNYSEKNLGCGKRPVSGITWVFEQVERAIVIEDDCIPDASFFPYAQELLERYQSDERVMHVAGSSFQEHNPRFNVKESYYASFLANGFGCWASWRRAWQYYDYDLKQWPALRDSGALKPAFHNSGGYERFANLWDSYYEGKIPDSWDTQWAFACMTHGGICLTPSVNLVRNIGFNERGTHTKKRDERFEMTVHTMRFPLVHPRTLTINRNADDYMFRYSFGVDVKLRYRLVRPIKDHFPGFYQGVKRIVSRIRSLGARD